MSDVAGMPAMLHTGLTWEQSLALHGTGLAFLHMEFTLAGPTYVGDTLCVVVDLPTEESPCIST